MIGLSDDPGRRYSGGAPSWLVDSVFVLLKERFRFFPFGKLESAQVTKTLHYELSCYFVSLGFPFV